MAPMEYLGAWGTLIHEKNLKSKISCQTPFNDVDPVQELRRMVHSSKMSLYEYFRSDLGPLFLQFCQHLHNPLYVEAVFYNQMNGK